MDVPAQPADEGHSRWGRWVRRSALNRSAMLLAAWLLVWRAGYLVEYTHHASVWFPVAGLTFAALVVLGVSALPALMAGCVLITVVTRYDYGLRLSDAEILQAGVLFGLAHLVPYGAGAAVLRRMVRRGERDSTRLVVTFLVIAASASLLATALVLRSLVASRMMEASQLGSAWLPFWVGDMAGVMALGPLCIGLLSLLFPNALFDPRELPEIAYRRPSRRFPIVIGMIGVLLVGSMLLAKGTRQPNSAFAIFFLVIPHMWIASTESPLTNALAVAVTSVLIAFLVNVLELMDFVMVYQFAISVVAANTLFGLAVPALAADNVRLRAVAFTDPLTRVASRAQFERQAAREIVRCGTDGDRLSLMLFDIDRFKDINDRLGHQAGDRALQTICAVVRHSLRPSDTLGRIGGDEFAVLLPRTDGGAAERIAQRICQELRGVGGWAREAAPAPELQLTASLGVAEWRPRERYDQLFARADEALYQAKAAGRNRIVRAAD